MCGCKKDKLLYNIFFLNLCFWCQEIYERLIYFPNYIDSFNLWHLSIICLEILT